MTDYTAAQALLTQARERLLNAYAGSADHSQAMRLIRLVEDLAILQERITQEQTG